MLIVIGHLLIIFFNEISWSNFPYIPLLDFNRNIAIKINDFLCSFSMNFGAFGVAGFFLITGFLTVKSLERDCSSKYLIKRFFRIYPTYIVGFAITFVTILVWCKYTNFDFPYSLKDYLMHITLFRNFLGGVMIDNGVWTLEINMEFYLLMWVVYAVYKRRMKEVGPKVIIAIATAFALYGIAITCFVTPLITAETSRAVSGLVKVSHDVSFYLLFTLVGSLFYFYESKKLSQQQFGKYSGIILLEILISQYLRTVTDNPNYVMARVNTPSYIYAILVFLVVFLLRNRIRTPKWLKFISKISYPLYIVHGLNGYIIMSYMIVHGANAYIALLTAVCISIFVSYVLNITIDKSSDVLCKICLSRLK